MLISPLFLRISPIFLHKAIVQFFNVKTIKTTWVFMYLLKIYPLFPTQQQETKVPFSASFSTFSRKS